MIYDDLLMWCSERGSGTLDAFHTTYEWLLTRQPTPSTLDWQTVLYNLQALSHIEVDWERRFWSVTPPVLTTLGRDNVALLVGQRPKWLLERISSLEEPRQTGSTTYQQHVRFHRPLSQAGGPSVRLATISGAETAGNVCDSLGIALQPHAGNQIAALLPRLQEMLNAQGVQRGPGGLDPQRMSEGGNQMWTDIDGPGHPPLHGAYRYQRYNSHRYIYWLDDTGFIADKRTVIYAELARTHRQVLRHDIARQDLYAPARMQLPHLQARAAILRSGMLPQLTSLEPLPKLNRQTGKQYQNYVRYTNISQHVAHLIANSLYQTLQIQRNHD